MSEEGMKEFLNKPITRRDFLARIVKGSVAVSSAYYGIPIRRRATQVLQKEPNEQTKGNVRFLTEEELEKAHIRIVQTPEVTLKLGKGIFDFPIFKDALEGKLKEVVVVLVDDPRISWKSSTGMPGDARFVWQAVSVHPAEHSDQYWKDRQESVEEIIKFWELKVEKYQKRVAEENDPKQKLLYEGYIFDFKQNIQHNKESLFFLSGGKEFAIKAEEEFGVGGPGADVYGQIVRLDSDRDYPNNPGVQKDFQNYPATKERFESLKKDHPELNGKVFIYIAVGGKRKPKPVQSYPKPEQFEEIDLPIIKERGYYRYTQEGKTLGTTLRHELSHYETDGASVNEYEADTRMFHSIEGASQREKKGDKSGYPFHFFTAEGETITKHQQPSDKSMRQV